MDGILWIGSGVGCGAASSNGSLSEVRVGAGRHCLFHVREMVGCGRFLSDVGGAKDDLRRLYPTQHGDVGRRAQQTCTDS